MRVDVVGLAKTFGKTEAVRDLTFSFTGGQIFGFVGPNGAGKTTTMRIMATLEVPDQGDVFLNGVSVVQEPEYGRRQTGYVPDALPAHADMTVYEFLDFFGRTAKLKSAERRQTLGSIIEFTNLGNLQKKLLKDLSKGMKQRVTLARALVHNPPFLLLDEPAAGLDPRARVELRELLQVLAGQGKSIFISSHILSELAEMCDGAVIIEQGQLLRAGTIDQLLQRDVPHTTLLMRPLDKLEELLRRLLEHPDIHQARPVGKEVEVDLIGGDEEVVALLKELITADVPLLEFRKKKAGLEDIFMNVTKGLVQ